MCEHLRHKVTIPDADIVNSCIQLKAAVGKSLRTRVRGMGAHQLQIKFTP